jgi:hypothetical protein
VLVWGGMWKPDRKSPDKMIDFLKDYHKLASQIFDFLKLFRIFLLPTEVDRRIRERIEAGIAKNLYEKSVITANFKDNDIQYRPRRHGEKQILLRIH